MGQTFSQNVRSSLTKLRAGRGRVGLAPLSSAKPRAPHTVTHSELGPGGLGSQSSSATDRLRDLALGVCPSSHVRTGIIEWEQ